MLDWGDREGDRFSFEDSDRFEEDSLCSWSSEPESLCNNWRGWKKPSASSNSFFGASKKSPDGYEFRWFTFFRSTLHKKGIGSLCLFIPL
ncbi:unnamed protein product [Phaedon cochleariae]|uniref:Uncharacterized protein n=1 Tax=Phaedon cochleariae TaxID=80249 RepID=A0A9N9SIR4_PHACE|nr:unnamed protein product [Phaedon cochleariae]